MKPSDALHPSCPSRPAHGRLPAGAGLRRLLAGLGLCALLLHAPAFAQTARPVVSCESLAGLALPQASITLAQTVAAGDFKPPARKTEGRPPPPPAAASGAAPAGGGGDRSAWSQPLDARTLPAFCRVAARLKPSPDSDIRIEVWLPIDGWNGNYVGVGGGGWAGSIAYTGNPIGLADALKAGYAGANTDAGHAGEDGSFIPGHPEKLIDYAYRANHEMTLTAKALIAAFYGVAPRHSVFVGCSLGSTQALSEASRYPDDYDGVVAGAAMTPISDFNAAQMWPGWLVYKNPARFIPPGKYTLIHAAAIQRCAGPVGRRQGFIEEPERCDFDPGSLQCRDGDAPDCLTAPQVELMRQIYAGPVDPHTGRSIFPGPAIGAELQLPAFASPNGPFANALSLYRYAVHQDAGWDWRTADFFADIALGRRLLDPLLNVGTDFTPFFARGGKLLVYIGWTDYHNPRQTMAYLEAVVKDSGGARVADAVRLFTVPGMDHCSGGQGCDSFDKIAPIVQWVATGKAPDRLLATRVEGGQVVRSRPLCAHPNVAVYDGSGNMDDAASFACRPSPFEKR